MIEADHHPSLHVDFGKFLPKLASYVNYLFAISRLNALAYSTPSVFTFRYFRHRPTALSALLEVVAFVPSVATHMHAQKQIHATNDFLFCSMQCIALDI